MTGLELTLDLGPASCYVAISEYLAIVAILAATVCITLLYLGARDRRGQPGTARGGGGPGHGPGAQGRNAETASGAQTPRQTAGGRFPAGP